MGFLDKLFGKKTTPKPAENAVPPSTSGTPKENKQNHFLTNSGDFGLGNIELGISGKIRVDGILAIAALEKIAKERNLPFSYNVMYTSLLEEGALTVPVVCTLGAEKYSVYFIYQEEDLLKYKDLVQHIVRTQYPNLIYFSSIPIYEGYTPTPIIEPFQLADLRVDKSSKIAGKFAMWWNTSEDSTFHQSKTYEYLQRIYELTKGYETYVAGYVLRQLRIVEEQQIQRMKLPSEHATFVIDAPEEKKILLDLSQEKGIRFLFPVNNTSPEYRERFLKGVLVDMTAFYIAIKQHQVPLDESTDPNSYDWFTFMSSMIMEKEKSGASGVIEIGVLEFNAEMN